MSIEIGTPTGTAVANKLFVDANSAGRVLLYDSNGNPLAPQNSGALVPATTRGILNFGADYKLARLTRSSPDGTLRTGYNLPLFYDSIEGTNVDTSKWFQNTTTMTILQAATTGTQYNAGSSVASGVGALQSTNRKFPFIERNSLVFRSKQRHTAHFPNNVIEAGFATTPATPNTVQLTDGAVWRKDGTGQYIPVVIVNGADILGTAISNATFLASVATTDYFVMEIFLEETRASFRLTTQGGAVVPGTEQTIDFGNTIGTFAVTHMQGLMRVYNNAATGTAVQAFVAQTSYWAVDAIQATYQAVQAGMGYGSVTDPTIYTQLANYANSAAPASATLSNTAAGYAKLGGQWQFAAVAGAETDFAIFGFQIPNPYSFTCTGVKISAWNNVVATATTATVLQWGLGFNSIGVSLVSAAPYPPIRKVIGTQTFPVAATVGQTAADVQWTGLEVVSPGRFFHVILKVPVGTATATEIFRGTCNVEGYFE